jgi:hypothetical protein
MSAPIWLGLITTLVLAACSRVDEAMIRYQVELRDGGKVPIEVRYTLPSGERRSERATTPWVTDELRFLPGTTLSLEGTTMESVDSPLLCNLVGRGDEGAWTAGTVDDPSDACTVSYAVGRWPPDDNRGSLIRVG